MKKLFTFVPIVCFILVILFMESTMIKWILLIGLSCLIVLAKYKRNKMQSEDFEYDDRVNANISKWSLRSIFVLNTVLTLILIISIEGTFNVKMNLEMIVVYLFITLCIPFYIVPAVVKNY